MHKEMKNVLQVVVNVLTQGCGPSARTDRQGQTVAPQQSSDQSKEEHQDEIFHHTWAVTKRHGVQWTIPFINKNTCRICYVAGTNPSSLKILTRIVLISTYEIGTFTHLLQVRTECSSNLPKDTETVNGGVLRVGSQALYLQVGLCCQPQ